MVVSPIHFKVANCVSHSIRVGRCPNKFLSKRNNRILNVLPSFWPLMSRWPNPDNGTFLSERCNNFEASSVLPGVFGDTISLACPAPQRSLAITFSTFAAVMCDADDPCSVDTAQEPESPFTTSPRNTTRPLHSIEFFRWHECISVEK